MFSEMSLECIETLAYIRQDLIKRRKAQNFF